MSVDTSYTTARFPRWSSTGNAAARPDACPALHLRSSRIAETQRQHRSFKPDLPIEHPQSQDPCALTASATRHATVKSP